MPLVPLGEVIREASNPGILGIADRDKVVSYISRALDLAIYKANWDASIGILDTCADWCGNVTLPYFVDTVLACNVNGQPSYPQNIWYEFAPGGAGSVPFGAGAGLGAGGGVPSAFSAYGVGVGGVGNAWQDRGWTPTFQDIGEFSALACITENPVDGKGDKFLIVQGETQTREGTEPVWTTSGPDGVFAGVKIPLLSSMATCPAQATLFRNNTQVVKPLTAGCVKLLAFNPDNPASARVVGHYTQRETLPRYRRLRRTLGCGFATVW